MTEKLNSLGGPANNIRKKARVLKLAEHQTGKNTAPERPLTTLEIRLLNITGKAAVEGFDNLPEYGILGNAIALLLFYSIFKMTVL
jgi:hypothetical protein